MDVQVERIAEWYKIGCVFVDIGFVQPLIEIIADAGHHHFVHVESVLKRGEEKSNEIFAVYKL